MNVNVKPTDRHIGGENWPKFYVRTDSSSNM